MTPIEPEILTPDEAATFLRVSRSTIYQRPDIPRHRMPVSRQIRFLRSELLAWIKGELAPEAPVTTALPQAADGGAGVMDISTPRVYHRNARYR